MIRYRQHTFPLEDFRSWLLTQGAEIVNTRSPQEVLRYVGPRGAVPDECRWSIIYARKTGVLTFTGSALLHFQNYTYSHPLVGPTGAKRLSGDRRYKMVESLRHRDGSQCFYCGGALNEDTTLEHLLAVFHGGTNHPDNLVLAHGRCNARAANFTIVQKIKLRDQMRSEKISHTRVDMRIASG